MAACNDGSRKVPVLSPELENESIQVLRTVMQTQQQWVKVHAAEFLIWTGNKEGVEQAFLKELELFHEKPQYRIGIWRVLAQVSDSAEAAQYKTKIIKAFLDTAGKDRIHAIETMAKLKISPLPQYPDATGAALHGDVKNLSVYTHWAIAYTNEDSAKAAGRYFLGRLLDTNEDISQRRIAAYVLRSGYTPDMEEWNTLRDMALALPDDTDGKVSFLNATLLTAPHEMMTSEIYKNIFGSLLAFSNKKDKGIRMDIAAGLATAGSREHLPALADWMRNADPTGIAADDADLQASAAYAILKIYERTSDTN